MAKRFRRAWNWQRKVSWKLGMRNGTAWRCDMYNYVELLGMIRTSNIIGNQSAINRDMKLAFIQQNMGMVEDNLVNPMISFQFRSFIKHV
jgi:hypothetical protein